MNYRIRYSKRISWKEFQHTSSSDRARIRSAIEERLCTRPDLFGKPLRRSLKGCRSLRVGDYRIVYRITGMHVDILAIAHRSTVYDHLERRLP